jgi:hypothetical protein
MALSHRALAAALAALRKEKEERVQKLSREEHEQLEQEATVKKCELQELERKKQQLEETTKKESEELEKLKAAVEAENEAAAEEQKLFDLQRRIQDFHGADPEALRERLVKEGFSEQLVTHVLRFRTLEQQLERENPLQPAFAAWGERQENPLERVMQGAPRLYDMTDHRVVDRLEDLRERTFEKGYLSIEEQQFVNNAGYFANKFEQNELYKGKDNRGYLARELEIVNSIRKHLGLEPENSYR